MFFGYTYCPDICPTSLSTVAEALDLLGEKGAEVVPLFITVDPGRDTARRLGEYVGHFHPRLVGLTGTSGMIARLAKGYGVTYEKVREPDMAADEYMMDHTASVFLMGRDGRFRVKFLHGIQPEAMADRIRDFLN